MTPPSLIDQVREMPLEAILAYHGLTPHREGSTTRYKNDQYNIVVGEKALWFDNAASVGGRGSIDLLLHLKYRASPRSASTHDFQEAVHWLTTFQPGTGIASMAETTAPTPAAPKESFASQAARLAIRDDARWPLARNYLLHTRRLPSDLVDDLYHRGDIYASFSEARPEQTGVCFLHRNLAGESRGATIRTASDGPGFPLSIGEKQGAWFILGDPGQANRAVLVEAPIDAISYATLKRPDEAVVMAMSCSHVFRPVLQAAHERLWPLTIGFDNDQAGTTGWERCQENQRLLYPNDPPARRVVPAGKDWNNDLRAAGRHRGRGRHL
jgi:hypothetical protein